MKSISEIINNSDLTMTADDKRSCVYDNSTPKDRKMSLSAVKQHKTSGYRFGGCLFKKGIVSQEILEKALLVQEKETASGRRKLGEILISDFDVERDAVYRTLAEMYAIPEIDLGSGALGDEEYSKIKRLVACLSPDMQRQIRDEAILPFRISGAGSSGILFIAAADPTSHLVTETASALGYSPV